MTPRWYIPRSRLEEENQSLVPFGVEIGVCPKCGRLPDSENRCKGCGYTDTTLSRGFLFGYRVRRLTRPEGMDPMERDTRLDPLMGCFEPLKKS